MTTFTPDLFLAAFGAGMTLILALLLARDFYRTTAARLFILLLAGANLHLFHNWLPETGSWRGYSYAMQSATPALFWMCCRLTFVPPDASRRLLWMLAFWSFLGPFSFLLIGEPQAWHLILKRIPQWLEYLLILVGLWEILRHWNNDLVEARRRLRGGVMIATGIAVGWGIFSFNFRIGDPVYRFVAINTAIAVLAWLLLQSRTELWQLVPGGKPSEGSGDTAPPSPAPVNAQMHDDLHRLNTLMADGFYRQENLTLAALADALQMPEYRLRATINKSLGYSNFNEYLNDLRIAEAARRLCDEPDTPITNIALDAGYRTMSSFNRAFRKIHNATPSEYREQHASTLA